MREPAGGDSGAVRLLAWSWRTPLGSGEEARRRLLAGESALAAPDPARLPAILAELPAILAGAPPGSAGLRVAPVPVEPQRSPDARYLSRMALLGMEAARELPATDRAAGVFVGMGGLRALWDDLLVALHDQQPDGADLWARGFGRVHPWWMLRHLSNNAHALLAMERQATGEGATFAGENAGAQALTGAIRTIRAGRLDRAIVVAYDTLLQPEILLEGMLSRRFDGGGAGEAAVALLIGAGAAGGPEISAQAGLEIGDAAGGAAGDAAPFDADRAFGQCGAAAALLQLVGMTGLGPGAWRAAGGPGPLGLSARVGLRIGGSAR